MCHHGMARPRVADRGDGLQIWRVAANILNKQCQTADRGWPSSLGVGRGLTTLPIKLDISYKTLHTAFERTECLAQPKHRKMDTRFGTWKVRSLQRSGSFQTVVMVLGKYKLDLTGVQEVRWDKSGTERK
jgi:hypothetical protein